MLHIVSDTSTLTTPTQAREQGFYSVPLEVTIGNESYADYEGITPTELVNRIQQGAIPSSSQPTPSRKLDLYNELLKNPDDEVLDISIGNGLSGTYTSACMMKDLCDDPDRVHVYNTKTLCGPQKAMVHAAVKMRDEGASLDEIIAHLDDMIKTHHSSIMVRDFDFLQRGGRVNAASAIAGKALKLVPVAVLNESGEALSIVGTARTACKAFGKIKDEIEKRLDLGTGKGYTIYLSHGSDEAIAKKAVTWFEKIWPEAHYEVNELCPMFIVHGGPGCLSVQVIKTDD